MRRWIEHALSVENSGYRLINDEIVPIVDAQEAAEVEEAITGSPDPVAEHLKTALGYMSDRSSPNYRNSIKESISAVESIAKRLTGKEKASLDDALAELQKKNALHPALKSAFSKLYGYTSDADGIRHALLEEENLTQADARYFLIVCSSFVNLLKSRVG